MEQAADQQSRRQMTAQESKSRYVAIAVILSAMVAMSTQAISMKYVSSSVTIWQITIFRSLIILSVLLPLFFLQAKEKLTSLRWLATRSLLMVAMNFLYYGSLPLMDVSVAATANYTAPIFIFVMGVIFLQEKVNVIGVAAIVLAFVGGVLVIRPGADSFNGFIIFPIAAALAYGCASVITRTKCRSTPVFAMVLGVHAAFLVSGITGYLFLSSLPIAESLASQHPFIFGEWVPMSADMWVIMFWLALLNTATHTGFAKAYQMAPSSILAPWEYTYLPFVIVQGFFVFGEIPDSLTVAAMFLIVTSGVLVLWSHQIQAYVSFRFRPRTH